MLNYQRVDSSTQIHGATDRSWVYTTNISLSWLFQSKTWIKGEDSDIFNGQNHDFLISGCPLNQSMEGVAGFMLKRKCEQSWPMGLGQW